MLDGRAELFKSAEAIFLMGGQRAGSSNGRQVDPRPVLIGEIRVNCLLTSGP
jgi:hypothetical protein